MNVSALSSTRRGTSLLMLMLLLFRRRGYSVMPLAALAPRSSCRHRRLRGTAGCEFGGHGDLGREPLERQLALISGVSEMTSTSSQGSTSITVQFDLSRSIDAAAQDVQAAINAASGLLPKTLPEPADLRDGNPADLPDHVDRRESDVLPLSEVNVYPTRTSRSNCPA